MKNIFALSALSLAFASSAFAGSSYVTGNVQFHDDGRIHGSDVTSTLEAGHTFDNQFGGFTVYTEFDGIQLGKLETENGGAGNTTPAITVGGEQSFNITDHLWVAAGYQHLFSAGENVQYRPLIKIGYNFDNGISLSNRTRAHIDATDAGADTDYRMDNRIGYVMNEDVTLSYNNVYMIEAETMDHEFRATWTRKGVQPYFELRSQAHGAENASGDSLVNNAFVFGASYGF
ncbi:oligogalacturonate-specific porin KdgM family protein [Vibrio parahaemolyticus]|uniref:oligogalacturonate-specific porin KdgM family protein n=1 Tax=Vibrio parahaemolyticus TaxID=670 RepID=UPI001E3E77A8|nr:oligogalacturonate-specific porin KdgM family protein [Vibrio parahaemolyticus]EJG1899008.1 porin [Vibrio parahaemolyticus]MDS1787105.1 oligogalacturonate-specific porin KdgM family protein [Vibrio parahaemolyticus]HCH0840825.1 porin [Vibrio parahaemolyticus]